MTTLVLLDTNAYLRLAKRIKPLLGRKFGQKEYVLTVLRDVEDEVHRNPRLQSRFPWFDGADLASERLAKTIRFNADEKEALAAATSVLHGFVLADPGRFLGRHRSPPSRTDCKLLAFGQLREVVVVTDDLPMHELAQTFEIEVWHGHELLKKMLSAKFIGNEMIRDIYEALENNGDAPATWQAVKHTVFGKIFGP